VRAVIRADGGVRLGSVARPRVSRPDDVIVAVAHAGVCRTDLYVAQGRIPVREPRVLGHEFAGVVAEVGPAARFRVGQRVAAMPWIGCGECPTCAAGEGTRCPHATMLGIDRDGAFAEWVSVPDRCVFAVPDALDLRVAAFAEPLCAALAVLGAGLEPTERVLLAGGNRIATVVERVLRRAGCERLVVWNPRVGGAPDAGAFDRGIETGATAEVLDGLLTAVRPGGTLVLRSRPAAPVAIDVNLAVRREIALRAVHYGDFAQALEWLADGFEVNDLFGASYGLRDFDRAFADARSERTKCFFAPAPASASGGD